jgi:Uma2 family endonuclease
LLNPTLIVEVLSASTEAYDRGKKLDSYRTIPSLQECVLIAQDEYHVYVYTRQPDNRWLLSEADDVNEVLSLDSIGCRLPLAEVYRKVKIAEADPEQPR